MDIYQVYIKSDAERQNIAEKGALDTLHYLLIMK